MTTNQNPSTEPDTTDDVEGNRLKGGYDATSDVQSVETDDVQGHVIRKLNAAADEGDDTDGHLARAKF